jgi:hypothetical protein
LWLQKSVDNTFFSPLSFVAVFGSGIQDTGSEIRDHEWIKIRIRDKHPGSAKMLLIMHSDLGAKKHYFHCQIYGTWQLPLFLIVKENGLGQDGEM